MPVGLIAGLSGERGQDLRPRGRVRGLGAAQGTQAIGLAQRGYSVQGTDLSPEAIERATHEAAAFGVTIPFAVADVRTLAEQVEGTFDAVLACDNALPHLLTDEDLRRGLRTFFRLL